MKTTAKEAKKWPQNPKQEGKSDTGRQQELKPMRKWPGRVKMHRLNTHRGEGH